MRSRQKGDECIAIFTAKGYQVLRTESRKLTCICNIHGEFVTSISTLRRGGICNKCRREMNGVLQRHPIEKIKNLFYSRNMIPMFDTYRNNKELLPYFCNYHLDRGIQYIKYNDLQQGHGCAYCKADKLRVVRPEGYEDVTHITIGNYLRRFNKPWLTKSAEFFKSKCVLGTDDKELNIHHVVSHSLVVEWAHKALGVDDKLYEFNYTQQELKLLSQLVSYFNLKYIPLGIPISTQVHKAYHEICGTSNTLAQWIKFEEIYCRAKGIKFYAYNAC